MIPEGEGPEVHSRAEECSPAVSTSSLPKTPTLLNGEEEDVLSELPPSTVAVKLRRPRSETDTRGVRMSLIPFKSRKRSQTVNEGEGAKSKEDQEVGVVSGCGFKAWFALVRSQKMDDYFCGEVAEKSRS